MTKVRCLQIFAVVNSIVESYQLLWRAFAWLSSQSYQCVSRTGEQCNSDDATIGDATVEEGNDNEVREKWVCTPTLTCHGQCINDKFVCILRCNEVRIHNVWLTPTLPLNSKLWSPFTYYSSPQSLSRGHADPAGKTSQRYGQCLILLFTTGLSLYFIFLHSADDVSNTNCLIDTDIVRVVGVEPVDWQGCSSPWTNDRKWSTPLWCELLVDPAVCLMTQIYTSRGMCWIFCYELLSWVWVCDHVS